MIFLSFLSDINDEIVPEINAEMHREEYIIIPAFVLLSILVPTAVITKAGPAFIQNRHSRCACSFVICPLM